MPHAYWTTTAPDIVLSNGNLTAMSSGSGPMNAYEQFYANAVWPYGFTGKLYWEIYVLPGSSASGDIIAVRNISGSTYAYMQLNNNGAISTQAGFTGSQLPEGAAVTGATVYVAYDVGKGLVWFSSNTNTGGWNGSATANPATGVGGVAVLAPCYAYGQVQNCNFTNDGQTANFGASAFVGPVPAGFISVNEALPNPYRAPIYTPTRRHRWHPRPRRRYAALFAADPPPWRRIINMGTMLLPATVVTTAGTVISPVRPVREPRLDHLTIEGEIVYGSGGTSIDLYVQTSIDGDTWCDIANFHATTESLSAIYNLSSATPVTTAHTPTDGSLAANTAVDGIFGDQYRVKMVTVGTYGGETQAAVWVNGIRLVPATAP